MALRRLVRRLLNVFRPGPAEEDLARETAAHLALLEEDYQNRGMTTDEARAAARRAFGGVEQMKDRHRDARSFLWLDDLRRDLQYAARTLARTPGFAATAILTLTLGIGANTAIFSLINSLLLRPLPVRNPDQLVLVSDPSRGSDTPAGVPNLLAFMWNDRMWEEIRQRPQLFDGAFGYFYSRFNLAAGGETDIANGLYVSGRFFETLGVLPILGRTLTDADDERGGGAAGPVAVITHSFWQRRFGGAADAVGRTLIVERVPFTIVGVLPPGFAGPVTGRACDIVIPVGMAAVVMGPRFFDGLGVNWLTIMARLKPGQTLEAANEALRGVQPQIRDASKPPQRANRADVYLEHPLTLLPAGHGNPLAPFHARSERPLWTMQLAVGLVLLIVCANVANLTLARSVARRHEMSVRVALGASSWRLGQQLFVESLLLASVGATGGFVLAQWGTRMLVRVFSTGSNALTLQLAPDGRVLAFTAGITIAASVLFGVVPARRATRVEPIDTLKGQGWTVGGTRMRLASGFVIAQVALSLVLLVGGTLLIRTYAALATRNLGFDPADVLVVDVGIAKAHVPPARRLAIFEEVRRAVSAVPGVTATALADITPVAGGAMAGEVEVPGLPIRGRGETFVNRISPGWLALYQTQMVSGRDFTADDRAGTRRVTIVNRAFAREFLNGADPLGHLVRQRQGPPGHSPMEWEIVGMTADAVYESLRAPVPPTMYWAFDQIDDDLVAVAAPVTASVSIRALGVKPLTLRKSVAAAIAAVDGHVDLTFRLLPDVVNGSITLERTLAILSGSFSVLSLLLAAIGLYGVTSYAVRQRRIEIGIRMALGATSGLVVRQVVSRVTILIAIGLLAGAGMSLWASQFVAALLYGLEPRDPRTLAGAAVVLAAVGVLAGWLPARRAARVDPLITLRYE
jgi:putative ABC transport system permease protein